MRRPGIEPGSQEWESCMIPLHQRRAGDCDYQIEDWSQSRSKNRNGAKFEAVSHRVFFVNCVSKPG